jgi:hypothetical protein
MANDLVMANDLDHLDQAEGGPQPTEGSELVNVELHHMRHHIDVGLVQVPPDPSMVGSDVKGELPSAYFHLPAAEPPVVNLAAPRERNRAVEVGEVEPVRDDPLERRIGLSDRSPV